MARRVNSSSSSFTFDDAALRRQLATFSPKVDAYVHAVMDYSSHRVIAFAKQNAPWRDQTGAARAGLRVDVEWRPMKLHAIHLFHSVLYGIWLEIRFAGKYAIIIPTLKDQGPATMKLLRGLFARLGKGGL